MLVLVFMIPAIHFCRYRNYMYRMAASMVLLTAGKKGKDQPEGIPGS